MTDLTPTRAETLEDATVKLDFERPLPPRDPRYEDLTAARGDQVMVRMRKLLERKQAGRPRHIVFTSHRGAGKSTELLRLMHDLRSKFHCVYFEANVEMDAYTIEMEDLLLVLARSIEEEMRKIDLPLPAALLDEITKWFSEAIQSTSVGRTYAAEIKSEVEIGASVPGFARLMSKVTGLFKAESSHRDEVKSVLRKYPGTLIDSVNKLLEATHRRLREKSGQELLVVIDNLDRYAPKVIDQLMVRGGDRFRELDCNLILTPPISLLYRPESGAMEDYFQVEVMPTVRLREQTEDYDTTSGVGRELLLRALDKRIDLDKLVPDAAARDRLVVASGGGIRELLEITSKATLEANGPTISLEDVEKAALRQRARMRDKINSKGWAPVLAGIANTKQITSEDACLEVLFHRLAFKYNGSYWYDVHPEVSKIPEFVEALQERRAQSE